MKVWVGLGNDEACYLNTRHNIGWLFLDALAENLSTTFSTKSFAYIAKTKDLYLVKLKTLMNVSGRQLQQVLNYYDWSLEDVLVIYDDIDFDLGTIKLRFNGGAGGHRGVASIINQFGTKDFWRLRLGIRGKMPEFKSKEHKTDYVVDYVLSKFNKTERKIAKDTFTWLIKHVSDVVGDPHRAMNLVNRRE